MRNNAKTYLSKEKHRELEDELVFLTTIKRAEIANLLEEAKTFGDLSENEEYRQAREMQNNVEARIRQVSAILESSEIVSHRAGDAVSVGSTVVIQKKGTAETRSFEIVGSEEADTASGKISLDSPLGKAMLGKKTNDAFTFVTPSGKHLNYTIVSVQ